MEKLVSIIIPTYNMGDLISKSIKSALNQTYKNIEIIIVDDGSTDNTKQIVSNFKSNKIKYIKQERKRNSAARNTGIKKSKGDYIIFLDADDDIPINSIECRVNYLENYKTVDCVFGNTAYVNKENEIIYVKKPKKIINPINFLSAGAAPFIPMTLMYRKNTFNKIGLFDEKIIRSQDADMCYRCINKLITKEIDQIVYNYHKYSHKLDKRFRIHLEQIIGKIKAINKNTKGITRIKLLLTNILFFPIKSLHQLIFFKNKKRKNED